MGLALHTGHAGDAISSLATFLANKNFDRIWNIKLGAGEYFLL